MVRTLRILGRVLLFAALILNFLVSISLPLLPSLDIARVKFSDPGTGLTELRLGIWAPCTIAEDGAHICSPSKSGYEIVLFNSQAFDILQVVWTRLLMVHIIATGFIFIAIHVSLFKRLTINLGALLESAFAALITLIASITDLAFFVQVDSLVKKIIPNARTGTAPGFWMGFFSFVLVALASVTFFFDQRWENPGHRLRISMQTHKREKLQFNVDS